MDIVKPVKCVFFDMDETLNYPLSGNWMFTKKAEGIINLDSMYYIPIRRFNTAYTKCTEFLTNNHLVKNMDEEYEQFVTFYKMLADYLPEFEINDEKAKHVAHDKVYNTENEAFYDDVHQTLTELSKNYKLGIISDSWPSSENLLKEAGLHGIFDCITLSCYLGVCKPDPQIFEYALSTVGLPAEETLLIDDSKENLAGAKACGMQTVLIDTKTQKRDDDFLTIHSISEILNYL